MTIEQAREYRPPWVRTYCPVHGSKPSLPHDLARFPQARNSYSCEPCQHGDHVACQPTIHMVGYSQPCTCHQTSPAEHADAVREARREQVAKAVYAVAEGQVGFWLPTEDGTPNAAAYAIADALWDAHLTR